MQQHEVDMKKHLTILLYLLPYCAAAQNGTFNIQEIAIQDTFLVNQINIFINETERREEFTNGLGYVVVEKSKDYQEDTLYSYQIYDQYASFDEGSTNNLPVCYAEVSDRLVLFETDVLDTDLVEYSTKSKRKLRKKLEPFLAFKEHLLVKDEAGRIVIDDPSFRPDEIVPLDGYMRLIYVFKNRPPVVEENYKY